MSRSRLSFGDAWQQFFDVRTYVPFLIGSVALGVISNGVFSLLTFWLGVTPPRIVLIIAGTLLVFILMVWIVALRLAGAVRRVARDSRKPEKRRGLIFLVSQLEPCRTAVAYHQPVLERCWLLCSTKTLAMAQSLRGEFARSGVRIDEPCVINDVNDPLEFRREVAEIYENLPEGWQPSDVIADYLGMTAHASVGMVLACLEKDRPLEYTLPVYDDDRRPIGAEDPMEIVLDWEAAGAPTSAEKAKKGRGSGKGGKPGPASRP